MPREKLIFSKKAKKMISKILKKNGAFFVYNVQSAKMWRSRLSVHAAPEIQKVLSFELQKTVNVQIPSA
jgi:hypothetical protein